MCFLERRNGTAQLFSERCWMLNSAHWHGSYLLILKIKMPKIMFNIPILKQSPINIPFRFLCEIDIPANVYEKSYSARLKSLFQTNLTGAETTTTRRGPHPPLQGGKAGEQNPMSCTTMCHVWGWGLQRCTRYIWPSVAGLPRPWYID